MLTVGEMAVKLTISACTVKKWRRMGLLRGHLANDKGVYLFEPPGADTPIKCQGRSLSKRSQLAEAEMLLDSTNKVQYES